MENILRGHLGLWDVEMNQAELQRAQVWQQSIVHKNTAKCLFVCKELSIRLLLTHMAVGFMKKDSAWVATPAWSRCSEQSPTLTTKNAG